MYRVVSIKGALCLSVRVQIDEDRRRWIRTKRETETRDTQRMTLRDLFSNSDGQRNKQSLVQTSDAHN